jgi:glycine cleavage system H protein
MAEPQTLFYKRATFVTHLPLACRYSRSHYWLAAQADGTWRIGLTRFATRMLGEMVDHGFETPVNSAVTPGQIIGWVEGFKAISDVYCVATGTYLGTNPALKENIALIDREPYGAGWLYSMSGTPDEKCLDVHAYREHLDRTIDLILSKQKDAPPAEQQ